MRCLGRMVLVVALTSCRGDRLGHEAPGVAVEAYCRSYGIFGVQVDPLTYHQATPDKLIESAEGAGPRTLNVAVSTGVEPEITVTGNYTPTKSEFSAAVGYDVTQVITLTADSSVLVPINAYARVDAYPAFQKAIVTIGADCMGPTIIGSGTVLKPVGVYFDTCGCIGPDPCGASCSGLPFGGGGTGAGGSSPGGSAGGSSPKGGAGGGDAGSGAGGGDAGASDGG
jgi:hypothetical protein